MIPEALAASLAAELFDLPFPLGDKVARRIVLTFAERCSDVAHCRRAVKHLATTLTRCPVPAQVIAAISQTYIPPPEPNPFAGVRCKRCGDSGMRGFVIAEWCTCGAAAEIRAKDPALLERHNADMAAITGKFKAKVLR